MGITLVRTAALALVLLTSINGRSEVIGGPGPLRFLDVNELQSVLPSTTYLMVHPSAVEQFLAELDGQPPDRETGYGDGRHDPGDDDRLFAVKREVDAKREGRLDPS